jgi:hypothetical protein
MRRNALSRILRWPAAATFVLGLCTVRAFAGPPYHTDDPEPTDYQHYENCQTPIVFVRRRRKRLNGQK